MSDIAKCPVCGGEPLDKWELTSKGAMQSGQMCCGVDCSTNEKWNQYAALIARHNALRDAVAWERECCQDIRPLVAWADLYARNGEDYVDAIAEALREIQDAARAEVDRLIANQGSADCKGEG